MKHSKFFPPFAIRLLLSCAFLVAVAGRVSAASQLAWSDEFDGTVIDPNHWTFDIGNGPAGLAGWGNNELEYYTSRPQNAYVTNGILHIVARQESFGGQNYTSAKMKTSGLFSKTYGRFEFRARLPQGQGYWPALWMMPQDSAYGGWASSGEIDVMENRGSDPTTVLGTIHFGSPWPNNSQSHGPSYKFPSGDSGTNFHVYAVEWATNSIKWFVDDQLFETQTNWSSSGGAYPAPFDQRFYILMNLAVGGNFGGNPDTNTVFPGEMQVDYVRAYNLVPSPPPPPPMLKLRLGLDDAPGSAISPSDTNSGGVNISLQTVNGAGASADYHGAVASGVAGAATGGRAMDFSTNGVNQPGNPGPLASVTSPNLGWGVVSNFVVTLWFKQNALMADGANIGPRMFVLGGGTPSDTGVANSIGLKFQTADQLYLQINGVTVPATFPTNVPADQWLFVAAVYDGANVAVYRGSDTTPATLLTNAAVAATIDFGTSGSLYLGNRQNRQRSFNGWIDDFRFYTGTGDAAFVEKVRLSAVSPPAAAVSIQSSGNGLLKLSWPNGVLQAANTITGAWSTVPGATSPYTVMPIAQQQFYRVQVQ